MKIKEIEIDIINHSLFLTEDKERVFKEMIRQSNLSVNKCNLNKQLTLLMSERFKTQTEAAEFLNTNQNVISNIINYKIKNISTDFLLDKISMLGVEVEYNFTKGE